jgi:phage terminase large subunit-like protein
MKPPPSRGGLAVRWIETALIHGEGDLYGQPFRLLPEQKLRLWRWYEYGPVVDEITGETFEEWLYRQALWGDPRGGGKSEFVAAIGALEFAGPEVFRRVTPIITIAAASRDNANELFGQCAIMLGGPGDSVKEAPLCGQFLVFDTEIRYKDGRPGRIERIAAEASTKQGGKTTLFLADEVHEWTGRKANVHSVISTSLDKRRNTREINLTTAGPVRGSLPPKPTDSIAWKLYAKGLAADHDPDLHPGFLFDWNDADAKGYDLDDEDDRRAYVQKASGSAAGRLWDLSKRVGRWNDPELRHRDFRRYFGNEWVPIGAGSWLEDDPTSWEALEDEVEIEAGAEIGLGVDMALRHDTAAVTLVAPLDDGRRYWATRVFEAERGRIDHEKILEWIDDLSLLYSLRVLAYDPRFFELPAQILADRGFPVVEVPQSPERMGRSAELVYKQIRAGEIVHSGDPVLAAHVEAGVWRETERGRMISKSRSLGPIDALVGGLLATYVLDLGDLDEDEEVDLENAVH